MWQLTPSFGEDAYLSIHDKAAALLQSIACNHASVDGNKRTAWIATRTFYLMNGWDLVVDEAQAYWLVMSVAEGALVDIDRIANELQRHAAEIPDPTVRSRQVRAGSNRRPSQLIEAGWAA